jgi:two-component system sensor histidine kinase/response regulator
MTANAMQGDRDRCMAAGMNDHVAKPIEPEDLWKALLKWIKPKNPIIPGSPLGQELTVGASPSIELRTGLLAKGLREQARSYGGAAISFAGSGRSAIELPSAVQPQVAQQVDLPSDIEGLDMINGLRRVLGKKALYLSMLRKFVAGQKSVTAEIRKALAGNDWDTAERLAHTLKGVSGNIGATGLQRLAEQLEAAIRERQSHKAVEDSLDELKMPLEMLIEQLEQTLPQESVQAVVIVDRETLKAVCDQLASLLDDDDTEAVDVMDANAGLLNAAFPDHCHEIENHIRAFDFEAALVALSVATTRSL